MNKIPIFQVDTFTEKCFGGNPAAVCIFEYWPDILIMQAIAAENNLAETAFIVEKNGVYEIRWFTPTTEVDLCGHATLASAFILRNFYSLKVEEISFLSPKSGRLRVCFFDGVYYLDFPSDGLIPSNNIDYVESCIETNVQEVYKGKYDYFAVVASENDVRNLHPVLDKIARLDSRGLIVTAPSEKYDFVSRFFAPQSGIDEDFVTGSAHTSLIPYWSSRLKKNKLTAAQLSKRPGLIHCNFKGERCLIGGNAILYLKGHIL